MIVKDEAGKTLWQQDEDADFVSLMLAIIGMTL